jgi:hypothetical protein
MIRLSTLNKSILASQWGLERVVSSLIDHQAEINKKVQRIQQSIHIITHFLWPVCFSQGCRS